MKICTKKIEINKRRGEEWKGKACEEDEGEGEERKRVRKGAKRISEGEEKEKGRAEE